MSLTKDAAADEDDFKEVAESNFHKIQEKASKLGYADGVADGREIVFQTGFNQGYADGLRTGFELEKYRAFYANWIGNETENDALLEEKNAFNEIELPGTKDKEHFQYVKHETEHLEAISQHQQSYIDDFVERCEQTFPLTTNLLAVQKGQ